MTIRKIIASTFLFMICAVATSAALAADVYAVSATIKQDGKTVATPSLRVKAGAPASVSLSGDEGYRLTIRITATETDAVDVTVEASTSRASVTSVVTTLMDKPMAISTGDIELTLTVKKSGS